MDDDYRDLANRLFATGTAMLEDAIEMAIAGQSQRLGSTQLSDYSRRLRAAAHDVAVIAEAAVIVADLGADRPQGRRNRSR